jgi:hypothetical protein
MNLRSEEHSTTNSSSLESSDGSTMTLDEVLALEAT